MRIDIVCQPLSHENMKTYFAGETIVTFRITFRLIYPKLVAKHGIHIKPAGKRFRREVGEILARLINMELAPLKRFTTQVYESMYKRSAFHNRQLEELLTVFISGLPDKPVTGLKQLLELYLELLTINRSKVTNEQLLQRLQEWATNSNLKKVTTSLNKL